MQWTVYYYQTVMVKQARSDVLLRSEVFKSRASAAASLPGSGKYTIVRDDTSYRVYSA